MAFHSVQSGKNGAGASRQMGWVVMELILGTCCFCNQELGLTMTYNNINRIAFPNMPINKRCHMECYIEKCVEISFEKMIKAHRDKEAGWS